MRRALVSLTLAAILAGCAGTADPSLSPGSSTGVSTLPPSAPAAATCDPIDLRLPSGEQLDLTGTWLGNDDGLYQVRQYGQCLWWVGQTDTWVHALNGTVGADFTISASWATVATSGRGTPADPGFVPAAVRLGNGTLVLRIEIGSSGTNDDLRLIKVSGTDSSSGGIRTTEWTRVDDAPDHPLPSPEF